MLVLFPISILLTSCGSSDNQVLIDGKVITRVEVYYRDFNVLSYMPYGEEQLIITHDLKIESSDAVEIRAAYNIVPNTCKPPKSDSKENLYALLMFYGSNRKEPIFKYKVSRFNFTKSDKSACLLDDQERDLIRTKIKMLAEKSERKGAKDN